MKQLTLIILLLTATYGSAQSWRILSGSPQSTSFRHDDVYFINADTGWVCNVDGLIYKTTDGGGSWVTQANKPNTSFRCIGFTNAMDGWVGNLGTGRWSPTIDTLPLYETHDGGASWNPVTTISGTLPQGICGINVVNDTVIYATGRIKGPSYLLKTTNAGASWTSIDMSPFASTLIDCHFFSADTGFVVGGSPGNYATCKYIILYTTNGGVNWTTAAEGTLPGFHCWKIQFIDRRTGFASIEHHQKEDSVYLLKTINGGLTWQFKSYPRANSYGAQGIGFVNDSLGWCGGTSGDTRESHDGGNTWTSVPNTLMALNRLRLVNPGIAYGVSNRVWKYSMYTTGTNEPEPTPVDLTLTSFPNPFSGNTTLTYSIPQADKIMIRIYDMAGRPIRTVYEGFKQAGTYHMPIHLDGTDHSTFFVVLNYGHHQVTYKLISAE